MTPTEEMMIPVKFKGKYRGQIHRNSRIEQLAFEEGDEVELDPELAAFLGRDAPGVLSGGAKILKTANRMISDSQARETAAKAVDEGEPIDPGSLDVTTLKTLLGDMGLKVSGNKATLVKRLKNALASEEG